MTLGSAKCRIAHRRFGVLLASLAIAVGACGKGVDPEHRPDPLLRAQLGLTEDDRVRSVTLTGGNREHAYPDSVSVRPGAYVQFVTSDWRIHEVRFDREALSAAALGFLERTDQMESPPLIERDSRFVVSFEGAPAGRYPYVLEGNAAGGRGIVVVVDDQAR